MGHQNSSFSFVSEDLKEYMLLLLLENTKNASNYISSSKPISATS